MKMNKMNHQLFRELPIFQTIKAVKEYRQIVFNSNNFYARFIKSSVRLKTCKPFGSELSCNDSIKQGFLTKAEKMARKMT